MIMNPACQVKEQAFAPSYSEITTEWKCYDMKAYFEQVSTDGVATGSLAGLTELPSMIALIQPAANQSPPIIHLFPQSEDEGNKMLFARGLFEFYYGDWFLGNIYLGMSEEDSRKDVHFTVKGAFPSPASVRLSDVSEDDRYFLYEPKLYVKP